MKARRKLTVSAPGGEALAAAAGFLMALAAPCAYADIAGRPDPVDVGLVQTCLTKANGSQAQGESCIGAVATPCLAAAASARAQEACDAREESVWNLLIVHDVARLRALAAPSATDALQQASFGYERAKLGLCTFERIAGRNSPDALLQAAKCKLNASGRQDLWLLRQIDGLTKK